MIRMTKGQRTAMRDQFKLRMNQALWHTNLQTVYGAANERFDLETEKVGKTTVFKVTGSARVEGSHLQWLIEATPTGGIAFMRPCFEITKVVYGNVDIGNNELPDLKASGDLIQIGPNIFKGIVNAFRDQLPEYKTTRAALNKDRMLAHEFLGRVIQEQSKKCYAKTFKLLSVDFPEPSKTSNNIGQRYLASAVFEYGGETEKLEFTFERFGREMAFELKGATMRGAALDMNVSPFTLENATQKVLRAAIVIIQVNLNQFKATKMQTPVKATVVPKSFVLVDGNGTRRKLTDKQMSAALRDLEKHGYASAFKTLDSLCQNATKILNGAKIKRRVTSGTEYKAMNVAGNATNDIAEVLHNANWEGAHIQALAPTPKKPAAKKPAVVKAPVSPVAQLAKTIDGAAKKKAAPKKIVEVKTEGGYKADEVPAIKTATTAATKSTVVKAAAKKVVVPAVKKSGKPTKAELAAKPVPKRAPRDKNQNDLALLSDAILGKTFKQAVAQNKGLTEAVTKPTKAPRVWFSNNDDELRQLLDAQRHMTARIKLLEQAKANRVSPEVQIVNNAKQVAKDAAFIDTLKTIAKKFHTILAKVRTEAGEATKYRVRVKNHDNSITVCTITHDDSALHRFILVVDVKEKGRNLHNLPVELRNPNALERVLNRYF